MMKSALFSLLSGGIDSTLATLMAIRAGNSKSLSRIIPVFIDYGQKSRRQEWSAVTRVSERLKSEAISKGIRFVSPIRIMLVSQPKDGLRLFEWSKSMLLQGNKSNNPEVENRNMVLVSTLASYAKSCIKSNEKAVIVTGFRDEFYDTSREFVEQLNNLFKSMNMSIALSAPAIEYKGDVGKKRLVDEYRRNGYKDLIDMTWSCYEPFKKRPCRKCPACTKRDKATN
jgi:7-cyano-7-deazaguanine synthase in queuosine biosynthesis